MIEHAQPRPGILTLPLLDHASCEKILSLVDAHHGWETASVVGAATEGRAHVNQEWRSASLSTFGKGSDVWRLLHPIIDEIVRPLVQRRWKRDFPVHSAFQIVRYHPGDFYRAHRDSGVYNANRYFAVVCYLNDDYEGGGTYFPDADYTVEPERGKVVIFPADYLHQAERVLDGTKYVVVTWLLAPPPVKWI